MGRRREGADEEEADDREREEWAAWTVEMRLELGAARVPVKEKEGTPNGGWRPEPGPIEEPVWRGSLPPFGGLAPPFPLPSPKLELVPQRPRSGGNELDLDGGRARFGGWKLDPRARGRIGR